MTTPITWDWLQTLDKEWPALLAAAKRALSAEARIAELATRMQGDIEQLRAERDRAIADRDSWRRLCERLEEANQTQLTERNSAIAERDAARADAELGAFVRKACEVGFEGWWPDEDGVTCEDAPWEKWRIRLFGEEAEDDVREGAEVMGVLKRSMDYARAAEAPAASAGCHETYGTAALRCQVIGAHNQHKYEYRGVTVTWYTSRPDMRADVDAPAAEPAPSPIAQSPAALAWERITHGIEGTTPEGGWPKVEPAAGPTFADIVAELDSARHCLANSSVKWDQGLREASQHLRKAFEMAHRAAYAAAALNRTREDAK